MPWSVIKDNDKFCVVKEGDTSPLKGGCHDSKSEAAAHVRALYASEAEAAVSELYTEEVDMEELTEDTFGSGDNFEFSDSMKEYAWSGPIVFENILTGDNRVFKADSINWQEDTLPWAFRWQKHSGQGHAGSVPIGRVDRIERKEDGSIWGFGVVIPELSVEADEYYKILKAGVGGGVSVDGDSAQFEIQEQDKGQPKVEFSAMRLRALSAVDIPAFNGARIHLTDAEATELSTDEAVEELLETVDSEELAEKSFPFEKKAKEEDDEDSEDEDKEDDEESEDDESKDSEDDKDEDEEDEEDEDKKKFPFDKKKELAARVHGWNIDESLVAAAIPTLPTTEAFIDPNFEGPTPLTVTPDGKVFGHLALFNTCHIGFPGTCVKPPKGSKYQYFHTGQIETAEGDLVEVGKLTFKTGHASMNATPRIASEHYDNTGAVAADVRAGEDKFGIWVVGALRPHLSDEDIREFRAAPLSGDWRRIAGRLELVGALSVNTPGFPVPRVKALVASGETETLLTFLEDDDEEFSPSSFELDLRWDKKVSLATKVAKSLGDETPPAGKIEEEVPAAPTKAELKARAENYTKNQVFEDLKALRELLDDPGEKMSKKVRDGLEDLYSVFIKIDDSGKKFAAVTEYDLDVIEASGLQYEEWEAQLQLSGLDIHEFYNRCHDENGRFCEGEDGPGRVRDNRPASGRHPIDGNPHLPGQGGREAGDSSHRHEKPFDRKPSGGPSGPPNNPPNNSGGGPNLKTFENHRITRKRAVGWAAAASLAFAALNSPASGVLTGIATAAGVGILANPLTLGLIFATGSAYAVKNVSASRKFRADYNRQVDRKLRVDKANDTADRIRKRAMNS